MYGKAFTFGQQIRGQCGNGRTSFYTKTPYCINDNYKQLRGVRFDKGSCGGHHTVLLDIKNQRIYGFGSNRYHQTGNCTKDYSSLSPYVFTKEDVGVTNGNIVNVICGSNNTIIVCELD